jgi:acyl-coenzyme A thioesterase 9
MEDLDALAGAISYKHTDDGKTDSSPLTIVTASVDRIDLLKPLGVCDLRLSGHVTYVGYSSMESKLLLFLQYLFFCNICG